MVPFGEKLIAINTQAMSCMIVLKYLTVKKQQHVSTWSDLNYSFISKIISS